MRHPVATHRRPMYGEHAEAVMRAIFGLSAGVGVMSAIIAAAADRLPLIAIPTLVLIGLLCVGPSRAAACVAASVWLVIAPDAPGEALLVPLMMIVLCLALAVGPDRFLSWLARDVAPGPGGRDAVEVGWIEEDEVRVEGRLADHAR